MTAHGAGAAGVLITLVVVKRGAPGAGNFGTTAPAAAAALIVLVAGQLLQKPPSGRESGSC